MPDFGTPNIDVLKRSNEDNMQSAKSWMMQTSESLNYYITNLENRVSQLEKRLSNGEEK